MRKIIVTAIGTDEGKTLVSSIIVEALQADYWKPIQAGNLEHTDTDEVKRLVSNTQTVCHKEAYKLKAPLSPHHSAQMEKRIIHPNQIVLPKTQNTLIIEGAGGVMVPLNETDLFCERLLSFNATWILVSKNKLGSINHTLLTATWLKEQKVDVLGIVFNGTRYPEGEKAILYHSGLKAIGHLPPLLHVSKENIKKYANQWKPCLL